MTAQLTVVYWRDIPAQITAKKGRLRHSFELPARFQEAIDSAAMAGKSSETDAYLSGFRKEVEPCSDDLEAEVDTRRQALEHAFTPEVLQAYVKAKGYTP